MRSSTVIIFLRSNAIFSALTGFSLLVFGSRIAAWMDIPWPLLLRIIGGGLLLFAGTVYWESKRTPLQRKSILTIIWMDLAWVMGSVVLLASGGLGLNAYGMITVGAIAMVVGFFAWQQYRFLPPAPHADREE